MNQPLLFQRAEGAAAFIAAVYFYLAQDFNPLWFVLLLFSIDVFMVGYSVNSKVGTTVYNLGHTYVIPLAILLVAHVLDSAPLLGLSLIWIAHIGLDRLIGYGLKLPTGFKDTHLGRIGRER